MEDHTTVFIRPSETGRETGFGLPPDLLEKSRRRIRIVGFLVILGAGTDLLFMLIEVVSRLLDGRGFSDVQTAFPLYANIVCVAAGVVLIVTASNRRIGSRRLVDLALVFEVLLCLIIATTNPLSFHETTGVLPHLTWVTPLIIMFPLIIPCPPRRTLVTGLFAAATRPLGIFILAATGRINAVPDDYATALFSPLVAVAIAWFGSRVVYGLGLEVADARRMGSYELVRMLGGGGMGEVWVARHRLLARPAAVKLIRPALLGSVQPDGQTHVLERFEREAQATASLRSPHTIGLYDFGVAHDGTFYYVMELLEGFDADALVRRFGPLPPGRTVHLMRQMCHSLAEAHEAGLVHRDIKPANVFVCRYGREVDFVKVLDFGLVARARIEPGDTALTAQNVITGTPAFMAPEQATGRDRGDARSDLYAVGCVGYWLLTGGLVFEGANAMEVLAHHLRTPPEPPSRRAGGPIPEALDRLILACLEKDPARRPADATALLHMLEGCAVETWTDAMARDWWARHASAEPARS